MKKIIVAGMAMMATPAFANVNPIQITSVPEISALEGTAALAAVAAVVLLAWERRRRAN
ncbi:VPEID-CTERM sorting domain-containing protein [Sulfitobacter sp. LCG007]